MAAGYIVAEPETAETFDIVARDPVNRRWYTFQVKSVRVRTDRSKSGRPEYIVDARRQSGDDRSAYDKADADYLIGVLAETDATPRAWLIENKAQVEYGSPADVVDARWFRLPLSPV